MRIKLTDDLELREAIKQGLKESGGYCPCRLKHSDDNKCICKEFREQATVGSCHCGLYEKVEE